jgi:hypothetical protein
MPSWAKRQFIQVWPATALVSTPALVDMSQQERFNNHVQGDVDDQRGDERPQVFPPEPQVQYSADRDTDCKR